MAKVLHRGLAVVKPKRKHRILKVAPGPSPAPEAIPVNNGMTFNPLAWGGEVSKAHERRIREGLYRYMKGSGIDIGAGSDPLPIPGVKLWDQPDGDATFMKGVADATYDFVFSSHCLEHIQNPNAAIQHWWRILKPGGYMILVLPHRDLYEKKRLLPSNWNPNHVNFWLPERNDPPHTFGLLTLIQANLQKWDLIGIWVCDDGYTITEPYLHSDGEYSIECVLRKRP